jgi:hypothetical protein
MVVILKTSPIIFTSMSSSSCELVVFFHRPCELYHSFTHYRQEGFGEGPMRSCYLLAARRLLDRQTSLGVWQERNGWLVPNLSPSDEGPYSTLRLNEYRIAGTFAAIFFLVMKHPIPRLSPHIVMIMMCGSCPPSYEYLKSADPDAAKVLAPWFDFIKQGSHNYAFSGTFRAGDLHHLLAEYLDEQV